MPGLASASTSAGKSCLDVLPEAFFSHAQQAISLIGFATENDSSEATFSRSISAELGLRL